MKCSRNRLEESLKNVAHAAVQAKHEIHLCLYIASLLKHIICDVTESHYLEKKRSVLTRVWTMSHGGNRSGENYFLLMMMTERFCREQTKGLGKMCKKNKSQRKTSMCIKKNKTTFILAHAEIPDSI